MPKFFCGLLLGCVLHLSSALAADRSLEQRVLRLSEQLRCLVCQNQTIAESHTGLAIDLRKQVREQLRRGRSERQVADYMVERYGDFVTYRPSIKPMTWLLWFGPLLLLGIGMAVLSLQRRAVIEPAVKSPSVHR